MGPRLERELLFASLRGADLTGANLRGSELAAGGWLLPRVRHRDRRRLRGEPRRLGPAAHAGSDRRRAWSRGWILIPSRGDIRSSSRKCPLLALLWRSRLPGTQAAAMQQPLAIAIISGLIVQMPLVLLIMPVVFRCLGPRLGQPRLIRRG